MFIDYLTLIMINLVAGTALLAYYLYKGFDAEDQRPYASGFRDRRLAGCRPRPDANLYLAPASSYNIAYGEATTLFGAVFLATALRSQPGLGPEADHRVTPSSQASYAVIVGIRIISLG